MVDDLEYYIFKEFYSKHGKNMETEDIKTKHETWLKNKNRFKK